MGAVPLLVLLGAHHAHHSGIWRHHASKQYRSELLLRFIASRKLSLSMLQPSASPTPPLPHTSPPPRLPPRLPAPTPPCSHSPHCPRPTLHRQRVYTIISELIGTLCFGYMISAVANLINSIDPNAIKIQAKVDQVKVYLRAHSPRPRNHTRSKKPRLCPYGLPSSRLPSSLS